MNKPTFISLHKFLPQHTLSRLMGFLADRPWGALTHYAIRLFIQCYGVNMQEAEYSDYHAYDTFNEFFTRRLKPGVRPMATEAHAIISPVDGFISEMGQLVNQQILQAKGTYYDVASLLANEEQAPLFHQGHFLTAYLAPKNYHRIHMPIAGRLLEMVHVPGRLFSVNPASVKGVPQLFARNERVICLFETAVGPMAMVMVGAMIVGSIATPWHGIVTPPSARIISTWNYREENKTFARGDEVGCFKLGSTVILLFPKNVIAWEPTQPFNHALKWGQQIGRVT